MRLGASGCTVRDPETTQRDRSAGRCCHPQRSEPVTIWNEVAATRTITCHFCSPTLRERIDHRYIKEKMMTISTTTRVVGLTVLALLTGCADPRLGPNSKTGWVTELYTPEKLQTSRPTCLAGLSAAQVADHQYAEVSVSHGRSRSYVSALVPASIKLHLHDQVEVSPPSCKDGAVPEVVQILEPAS